MKTLKFKVGDKVKIVDEVDGIINFLRNRDFDYNHDYDVLYIDKLGIFHIMNCVEWQLKERV